MLKVPMLGIWTIWAWVLAPSPKIPTRRPDQNRVILSASDVMAVETANRGSCFGADCIGDLKVRRKFRAKFRAQFRAQVRVLDSAAWFLDSATYCSEAGFFNPKGFCVFKVLCLGYRFFRHWHHALQTDILTSDMVTLTNLQFFS